MSLILSQQEAEDLLALEKHYFGTDHFSFPGLGGSLRIPLHSNGRREEFNLDLTRGRILLSKNTFQTRARKVVILARLDLDGPSHRNPDGEEIDCPHLHLYREGYGDKWATPLPEAFSGINDTMQLLDAFMDYCRIVGKPMIDGGLFV
ncbi:hypothetical protein KKD52_18765 [Myxococcota bacterium]|nr:hypothetical protein [Myxococcota bacterium]MBU1512400.1 hypothetical protein [Myxococcota bacterium]